MIIIIAKNNSKLIMNPFSATYEISLPVVDAQYNTYNWSKNSLPKESLCWLLTVDNEVFQMRVLYSWFQLKKIVDFAQHCYRLSLLKICYNPFNICRRIWSQNHYLNINPKYLYICCLKDWSIRTLYQNVIQSRTWMLPSQNVNNEMQ